MKVFKKVLLSALALVLVSAISIGATLAFLADTDSDVNVMTVGNVKIEQIEQERDANGKLVPFTQAKPIDPAVYPGTAPTLAAGALTLNGADYDLFDASVQNVIDKIVTVKNTGIRPAYIRTVVAHELSAGSAEDLVVVNDTSALTADITKTVVGKAEIDGVTYAISVYTYLKPVQSGETTIPSVLQYLLKSEAGNAYVEGFGNSFDVLVFSQAVQTTGFTSAKQALDKAFGAITEQTHPWTNAKISTVATDAELRAAMTKGGTVMLLNDLDLDADSTITIPAGVTTDLFLNGFTIASESAETGANRNLIDVRGTLNVSGGTITTKHTGANMGWSNSTNVFNVTAGGVLNINNAEIKNLGGSDMAFCVHMNNWGEVTLNVDNSVLSSTYCAVRAFNSGNDMNNISITNSSLIATRALWVHNYTAADFGGNADKAAAADARLNINVLVDNPVTGLAPDDKSNLNAAANNVIVGSVSYGFTDRQVYYSTAGVLAVSSVEDLQEVLDNASDEVVIYLSNDITGDITVDQPGSANLNVVIDGQGFKYDGQIKIKGNSSNGTDTLLIKNINFETSTAGRDFIWSADSQNGSLWRYAHNVTIRDCTFTATGDAVHTAVGARFQQAYNITLVDCTATNVHSLLQAESCGSTVTVDSCEVVNGKNGVSLNNTMNAIVKNTVIDSTVEGGYGIRHKGQQVNYALTVENCTVNAFVPVLIRNMTASAYTATFSGTNVLTATNDFGYEIVLCAGDWDNDAAAPAAPTGNFTLTGADAFKVFKG